MGKKMRRVRRNRLACAVLGAMLLAETVLASGCTQTAQDPGDDVQSMVSAAGSMPESSAGSESAAASEAGETDSASQAQRPGGEAGSEAPVSPPKERGTLAVQSAEEVTAELERAIAALYAWLTENVQYDRRYYTDPASMPYNSTTAYGALSDHLAICGGYAQALQLLFEKAGIPCVTVSGVSSGENHMWDLAFLDGEWRYFDATSDRGMQQFGFRKFGVTADGLTGYTWDEAWVQRLAESLTQA